MRILEQFLSKCVRLSFVTCRRLLAGRGVLSASPSRYSNSGIAVICGKLLLTGACMGSGLPLLGQESSLGMQTASGLEVTVLYSSQLSNVVPGDNFWMQGGSVQADGQFWHGWGAIADVSGAHTQNASNSGVGLDMMIAAFGPRYRWSSPHRRYAFFGQALAGEAFGFTSVFPGASSTSSAANSLAFQLGGGMDVPVAHHFSVRVIEADWLHTQLPNSDTNVQNNLRLGAGIVLRFPMK